MKEAQEDDEDDEDDDSDSTSESDGKSTDGSIPIKNQAIINLLGVDVRHLAWFTGWCLCSTIGTIGDLGVSFAFLGYIIGCAPISVSRSINS